jgi:hypothetical protein
LPSLIGLSAPEAILKAQALTHKVRIKGFGLVKGQFPGPGTFLRPGSRIEIILGQD